ncbi:hypothetical protein [Agrococcus versicolor]
MSPYLPGSRGTQPCPNCGGAVAQSDRYPSYLCLECEARAVDANGARVAGSNASFGGGFVLHWPDGEHEPLPCISALVWVDGREWDYSEARFGGVLITPARKR